MDDAGIRGTFPMAAEMPEFSEIRWPARIHGCRNADLVVTATEQVREYLIGSYPSLGAEKFICIPNGYDLDDFRNRKVPTSGLFEIS